MRFPEVPESFDGINDEELAQLRDELVTAFNEATAEGVTITDEDVASLTGVTESIERIRGEEGARAEAATARADALTELSSRVNPVVDAEAEGDEAQPETETEGDGEEGEEETETPAEPEQPAAEPAPQPAEATTETAPELEAVAATGTKKAVTAGASVAQLKRNAPARTRPRAEAPEQGSVVITAAVDVPGLAPGQQLTNLRQVAEALCERHRTIGSGNGDAVQVARFTSQVPDNRRLTRDMSPEQIQARLESFNQTPQGIVAAGGLCAPVNSYYEQMIIADTARPVRDGLANFQADRGGIRYNPPPKLSSLTSGVASITAAQDAAGSPTKTPFTVTCNSAVEVDIVSTYTSLLFGNIGARAFPEWVEAWTKLALAKGASQAETLLLNALSAGSTQVALAGLVGAGRELFARLGQVAAGYRSRNRMQPTAPLQVFLPSWTLDLVQADFARTFTDETGLISMGQSDVEKLFGVRGLLPTWYLDSKTGGGQVFGAAQGGQTYTDGVENSSTTFTSATAAFTSADVGKTITGAGIPASTTISAVGSATSITLSAAATATGSGVTFTVGRTTAAQFPTTVDAFLFPAGSWLHLDAGTLDLGLVRDSTLNSTNQFQMFSETFENAALVGPESLEVILTLSPDGSYAAAKTVTSPINS